MFNKAKSIIGDITQFLKTPDGRAYREAYQRGLTCVGCRELLFRLQHELYRGTWVLQQSLDGVLYDKPYVDAEVERLMTINVTFAAAFHAIVEHKEHCHGGA